MQLDIVKGDLAIAVRNAIRRPGLTAIVVLTLAAGLGINASIFALVDTVLLRPLPYRAPDRVVFLWQTLPQHNVFEVEATPADYAAWHRLNSFASLAMISADSHTLTGDVDAERVRGARVTASLMPLLGISPAVGRGFVPAEDDSRAAPVAILSDGLWRRRYGSDPSVIGRVIQIDGAPHVVIGVMPAGAVLPGPLAASSDLWLPARMAPDERLNEISHNYTVIGRLADGATLAQASSEIVTFAKAMAADQPATHHALGARIVPIAEDTVKEIRPALIALLGGVAVLLLAASANVATLLLSRAASRTHEAAIRTALGASGARLLWHATAEALVLTTLGAVSGLAVGAILLRLFVPAFADSLPAAAGQVRIGGRVAGAVLLVAGLLGVALGGITSRRHSAPFADALRTGRRTSASPRATRARHALVIAQVAFAVILLVAAGLMARSIVRLAGVSPGFKADHVLTFRLALESGPYESAANRSALVSALTQRIAAQPGVSAAAVTSRIPLGGARGADGVDIEGRTPAPGETVIIDQRHVTPDYFGVMRIPLLSGRTLADTDAAGSEAVAVINRTMADEYFPAGSPINRRVRLQGGFDSGRWIRIVGVVDDVRHVALSRPPVPEMYRPYVQAPAQQFTVVVRTQNAPAAAAGACRAAVRAFDPNLPLYDLRTMEDRIAGSFAETRATALLLALTSILAALLAAIAIYGSTWYSVTQRIPEIGIRLALGATRVSVSTQIIGRALSLTAAGATAGAAAALAARPVMAGLLFETRSADPVTIAAVVCGVVAITLVAAAGPVRRAISVDPAAALRCE